MGGDHSISSASCQAFIDKYKEKSHIIWIDAHTDINTSETSNTQNTHGMPVASLMGLTKSNIVNKLYNLRHDQITYIGPRSIDPYELKFIQDNNIKLYSTNDIKNNINEIIKEINEKIKNKYENISYDIDVMDSKYINSTGTIEENGFHIEENMKIIEEITKNNSIISADFVELNLYLGNKEKSLKLMIDIIKKIIINL